MAGDLGNLNEAAVHVTIVFVDIVGSTDKIARIPLDDARDALDAALERIQSRIHQFDGVVARIQGDGLMAIFGAPRAIENHAFNACYAARNIRDNFRALAGAAVAGQMTSVRIGIHSGTVMLRKQVNDFGSIIDIVGVDAHLAKKVEAKCPVNSVLLTQETLDLAGPALTAKPWGEDTFGGERRDLFELEGISLEHDLSHQFSRDHLSPLIGRRDVLDRLVGKLDTARRVKGTAFSIIGEAGVGKSRLLFELSKAARAFGYRIEELHGHAVQSHTPFAPLKALVHRFLNCAPDASLPAICAALAATGLEPALRHGIMEVLGMAPVDDEWNMLDAPSRRRTMLKASCALVERVLEEGPLLLIAEDAHNLDPETGDFLAELKGLTDRAPLAVVVSARNVARDTALKVTDETVDLAPLTADEAWELSNALISGSPVAADALEAAIQSASGNPLFLQAMIRDLRAGKAGRTTPSTVTALVQTRVSRLSAKAKEIMWAASILREHFDRRTLASTVGIDENALAPLLAELDRQDLIDVADPAAMRFRHDVFRAAANDLLLRDARKDLNRRVMLALEQQLPHTPERLESLAHHSEQAGEIDAALRHILAACRVAVRTSSLKTVRALYHWAMRLKPSAPAESAVTLVDVSFASVDALQQSGDPKYREALEFVVERASLSGNLSNEGFARAHLALLCWIQAKHDEGRKHALGAMEIARELRSLQLLALAQPHLANIEYALGNLDRAIALHLEIVQALEGNYEKSTLGRMIIPSVRSRAFAAWFLAERGRFAEAQEQIERGEATLRELEQPYSRVLLNTAIGILAVRSGRPADAIAPLEQARDLCLALHYYVMEACVSGWLGIALVQVGNAERACTVTQYSVNEKLYRQSGRYSWVFVHIGLAEALFASGQVPEALEAAGTAIAFAEEFREPIQIANARFTRGRILSAAGDRAYGHAEIQLALSMAEKLGLEPLAASCRAALGLQ